MSCFLDGTLEDSKKVLFGAMKHDDISKSNFGLIGWRFFITLFGQLLDVYNLESNLETPIG
jgi:hypothetical protein